MSERERIGVRDGQLRRVAADFGEASCCAAVQLQLRRTAGPAVDFDVAPQHVLRAAGAQRFHRRFFRGEPAGEMNRRMTPAHAVRDLAVGENPVPESIAVAFERRDDARDFCGVKSKADDGHASQA